MQLEVETAFPVNSQYEKIFARLPVNRRKIKFIKASAGHSATPAAMFVLDILFKKYYLSNQTRIFSWAFWAHHGVGFP